MDDPTSIVSTALADHWTLPRPWRLEPLGGGYMSNTWTIHLTDGSRWVVKFAHEQSPNEVGAAARAMAILDEGGVRVCLPRPTIDGKLAAWVGRRPLWVLRHVPGTQAAWGTPSGQRAIGSALGLAHRVLRDGGTPGEFPHHRWAHLQDPSYALGEAWVRPVLDAAITSMRDEEARISPVQGVSFYGGPGILIDEDGTTGLVDIGEMGWGPLAFDLGFFAWLAESEGASWAELSDAYLANAPVPETDLDLLPTYIRFGWAHFAWFHATRLTGHWVSGDRQSDDRLMLEHARKQLARYG